MFILPSRGRPELLQRFILAYKITEAEAPVTVVLDDDDTSNYKELKFPSNWMVSIHEHGTTMVAKVNQAFECLDDETDFVGFMSDDVVPFTPNWDSILIESAGDWGISYGRDGIQNEKLPTHGVMGRKLANALGWVFLPELRHLYGDNYWREIGLGIGELHYHNNVEIQHFHFSNGKAAYDETYRRRVVDGDYDHRVFDYWMAHGREADLERVKQAMDSN
jgi:hypothetical protein